MILTYVSSVKLTALLYSETAIQGSSGEEHAGTYQLECLHHAVLPTLGTHQLSQLVLLAKLIILLYKIHSYKFTTAYTQTVQYSPQWMPTSLVRGSDLSSFC